MRDVCLYMQLHQPHRLRRYRVFDIGSDERKARIARDQLSQASRKEILETSD